ncbi:MAG: ATP-binding protein, partial [Candidatus Woesearchaeota archaeon]
EFISANKLIELRNQDNKPLLILIPANTQTAAEDSYGNATFKEISLEIIEQKLYEKIISEAPQKYQNSINTIIKYPYPHDLQKNHFINFLLEIEEKEFNEENIGNSLSNLELIPDKILLKNKEKTRSRLNFNIECIGKLSNFGKPLYERISNLPIENNTIQSIVIEFFKSEPEAKTRTKICEKIKKDYPKLNFSEWSIPDLDFEQIELYIDNITSKQFTSDDGEKTLNAANNQNSKVKIRIRTSPKPIDIDKLKYFRIVLMEVDGRSGNEVMELRKLKKTNSRQPYRDAQIEINPSIVDEGSYFFRVYAEDEHGGVLNQNDKFYTDKIQYQWEDDLKEIEKQYEGEEKNEKIRELRTEYDYKKTCDSEDFDLIVEEEPIETTTNRREKINTTLQAYFQYRIDKLKSNEEPETPVITEDSGFWINDASKKIISTYSLKYDSRHIYQTLIPVKLRNIESIILNNNHFGYLNIELHNNPSAHTFISSGYNDLNKVNQLIPDHIIEARKELFELISNSTGSKKGIFETFDFYNHIEKVRYYLTELSKWTTEIKDKFDNLSDVNTEEKAELQELFLELQNIDIINITTKLPDKTPLKAIIISPLHPLRLTWHLQLYDLFSEWEQKTIEYEEHSNEWHKNLENLFVGELIPENNPLTFVSLKNNTAFQYAGELQYGWAVYVKPKYKTNIEAISSVNRQIKAYLRNLLNISSEKFIDTDISQKLVTRHIKNYVAQHPYTDKLIFNLFNAGDATIFSNSLIELEQDKLFENISYEIRLFKGADNIVNHGNSLKQLINPEYNVSEEAEAFSQPSTNKLFPKLRFSVNNIKDYLLNPEEYSAHISFLISPFPSKTELLKVRNQYTNFYLNGVLISPQVIVENSGK